MLEWLRYTCQFRLIPDQYLTPLPALITVSTISIIGTTGCTGGMWIGFIVTLCRYPLSRT